MTPEAAASGVFLLFANTYNILCKYILTYAYCNVNIHTY